MSNSKRRQLAGWLLLAVVITAADQWSKFLAAQHLAGQTHLLTSFLSLIYAQNTGAAFGFLAHQEWARWFLLIISTLVIIILLLWLRRLPSPMESAGLSLLLGGAVGNLIDRWRFGYVIDFIDAHWGDYHWPAFNIADSAITIGAALLIWRLTFAAKN